MRSSILLLVMAAACGGNSNGDGPLDIPPGDDPGEGSSTLLVNGIVETTELVSPATRADEFSSSFSITVTLDGAEVRDAVVTVSSLGGNIELTFDASGTTGSYTGVQAGYFGSYRLDIDSGADFVGGVVLEAPDVHQFLAPLPGARVASTDDLEVQWSRDGVADRAEIESRDRDRRVMEDTGTFTIDASDLRQDPDKDEEERVRIFRTSRIVPVGAVAGSEFEIRLRNSVEFIVENQ